MIRLSNKVSGDLPRLAENLTYPSDKTSGDQTYITITGIDPSGGLVTALSLTGKWSINSIRFIGLTPEQLTIKLTVDSEVVWNATFNGGDAGEERLIGEGGGGSQISEEYMCNTSLLLEIQTQTDNDVQPQYLARPIK